MHPKLRAKYALRHMKTRGSNRNLRKAGSVNTIEAKQSNTLAPPEIDSWQPTVLTIEGPHRNCWLVDSTVNVHVCNDKALMMKYQELPTRIGSSTSDGISPSRESVRLRLAVKDGSEGLVLNLRNVFYLPNSPCNLVSLGLLNDSSGIFHNNKAGTLYEVKTKKTLAQAQRWRNSYLFKPLNLSERVINLLRVDNTTYQWPPHALRCMSSPLVMPLSTWHKRLGHTNFSSLKTFLCHLNLPYTDDSDGHICDSCQHAKTTKIYNREPQSRAKCPYQFIHIDLIGPISPIGFVGERYFFTFTNDCTRMTETYTGTRKSDWLKCLKTYHSLYRTRSKEKHTIERLQSDYSSELQSHKADEWMQKEGIVFEPSAPYFQEQNGVSERMKKTIMDMTRANILEGNIDDKLWPKLVLAMTHVKNCWSTKALQNLSPHKAHFKERLNLSHLRILSSNVYMLLHEEKRAMKSKKWAPRALNGVLVDYNGHTLYRVHIKSQKKVIWVKNLRIFKDDKTKATTELPDYNNDIPTFQRFLFEDNNEEETGSPSTCKDRKVINAEGNEPAPITCIGRKVDDTELQSNARTGQRSKMLSPPYQLVRAGRSLTLSHFFFFWTYCHYSCRPKSR